MKYKVADTKNLGFLMKSLKYSRPKLFCTSCNTWRKQLCRESL